MDTLRVDDLRAVIAFGHAAAEYVDFGQTPTMLGAFARLVGADTATLTHLDLASGHEVAVLWPPERASAVALRAYPPIGHLHPLRPALARQGSRRVGHRRPPRISDLMSARQWRSHPVRSAMPEVADQLSILLAGGWPVLHAITFGRLTMAFDDRQRDRAAAAGPMVVAPFARSRRSGHRALRLSPEPGWVAADSAPTVSAGAEPSLRVATGALSEREIQVLRLVADGLTDAQVARRLGIRPATVSKHLARIYARIGVPNRAAAVRHLTELLH